MLIFDDGSQAKSTDVCVTTNFHFGKPSSVLNRINEQFTKRRRKNIYIHSVSLLLRDLLTFKEHKMESVKNGERIERKKRSKKSICLFKKFLHVFFIFVQQIKSNEPCSLTTLRVFDERVFLGLFAFDALCKTRAPIFSSYPAEKLLDEKIIYELCHYTRWMGLSLMDMVHHYNQEEYMGKSRNKNNQTKTAAAAAENCLNFSQKNDEMIPLK